MHNSGASRRQMDEFIIDEMRRKQNERLLTVLEEEQYAEQVWERVCVCVCVCVCTCVCVYVCG